MSRLRPYTKVEANQSEISRGNSTLKDREHSVFVEPMALEVRVEGGRGKPDKIDGTQCHPWSLRIT